MKNVDADTLKKLFNDVLDALKDLQTAENAQTLERYSSAVCKICNFLLYSANFPGFELIPIN